MSRPTPPADSVSELRAAVAETPTDIRLRQRFVNALVQENQLDEATAELLWAWHHMLEHEPSMHGVRHSFFLTDIRHLAGIHRPAFEAFKHARDSVRPSSDQAPDPEALADWCTLNEVFGDHGATVDWYDAADKRQLETDRLRWMVECKIAPLYIDRERWADAGRMFFQPLASLRRRFEISASMRKHDATDGDLVEFADSEQRKYAGSLVRALRAAGRTEDAAAVAEEARRRDPSDDMANALTEV